VFWGLAFLLKACVVPAGPDLIAISNSRARLRPMR
jgi:hypothetical protein